MKTDKPHRTAIEIALAVMRLKYTKLTPPVLPEDTVSRALTMPLTEVVMRQLADAQDAGESIEAFAQGLTHALGNVIASVASNLTRHQQPAMQSTAMLLGEATFGRAVMHASGDGPQGAPVFVLEDGR